MNLEKLGIKFIKNSQPHIELAELQKFQDLNNLVIGKRLRELRTIRGFTLENLAKKTGLSVQHLHNVETGRSTISVCRLEQLAKILHVQLQDFYGCDHFDEQSLQEEYHNLVHYYLRLSPHHRAMIIELCNHFEHKTNN